MGNLITRLKKLADCCIDWSEYYQYDMECIEEAADELERYKLVVTIVRRGSRIAQPPDLVAALDAAPREDY